MIAALITSDEVDVKCGEEVEVTQFGPNLVAAVNGYAGVRKTNHLSFEFRDKSDGRGKPHLALRIVRLGASDCALRIAHCARSVNFRGTDGIKTLSSSIVLSKTLKNTYKTHVAARRSWNVSTG